MNITGRFFKKFIYTIDLTEYGVGHSYFSSYRKAVDYAKSKGYILYDYRNEWITIMSLPPSEREGISSTHVIIHKEPLDWV